MEISMTKERELFLRYLETKDNVLLNEITYVYTYIPEILARRFNGKGLEFDDIYQSACVGLVNAIKRFDPNRGTRFSTFATPTVLGEIKRLFRDKGNCIRVPRRVYEIFSKANKIRNEELVKTGRILEYHELAEELNLSTEQLAQAMYWGDTQDVYSLEQPLDEQDVILGDCIGVEDDKFLMIENKDFVETFLNSLPERERRFVQYRYYDELSQSKIAELMETSQMNISRMEKKVLERLRNLYKRTMFEA
ncbi:MAG: sigma-70 family RNA polymerase sigma factor [Clostridia bacterium]|nr:sigma-70 family RNA polymerase sigma factor [Clostridia bacterium]